MSGIPAFAGTARDDLLIPAGPFLFGEEERLRYLSPFRIDRHPITVGEYRSFLERTGHSSFPPSGLSPDPDRLLHPVTGVSWFDAEAFAHWLGRDLPTEEEWEKAARGTDARIYPWGDRFDVHRFNSRASRRRGTTPVDTYPTGASPFGVLDLCGNVWEWTETWYDEAEDLMVLKGGCHALTKEYATISWRHYNAPGFGNTLTGFRTVFRL